MTAFGVIVYALADLIASNPSALFWIGYTVAAAVVSIAGSWGITEYWKRTHFAAFIIESINKGFNAKSANDVDRYERERRVTYRVATYSAFLLMIIAGYIFRLLESDSPDIDLDKYIQVALILWGLLSVVVGVSSAPLWRLWYDKIRPRMFKKTRPASETPAE